MFTEKKCNCTDLKNIKYVSYHKEREQILYMIRQKLLHKTTFPQSCVVIAKKVKSEDNNNNCVFNR